MEIPTWAKRATYQEDNHLMAEFARSEYMALSLARRSIISNAVALVQIHGDYRAALPHIESIFTWAPDERSHAINAIAAGSDTIQDAFASLVMRAPRVEDIKRYELSTFLTHSRMLILEQESWDGNTGRETWAVRYTDFGQIYGSVEIEDLGEDGIAVDMMEGHLLSVNEIHAIDNCLNLRMRLIRAQHKNPTRQDAS